MMKRNLMYAAVLVFLLITPNGLLAEDAAELFKETYQKAEAGDVEAKYNLGRMYYKGEGVPQDYKEAVKWYSKAAEQGNAYAQFNLALMYENGEGVPQDYKQAVKWYTKAAEQGTAYAQFKLGFMYLIGQGVPQDYKKAASLFSEAAEQGDAKAQSFLGVMYCRGDGVSQDFKEAVKWSSRAAEQGNADAQLNLGVMYSEGEGVPQDYEKAASWFSKAAEQGNADAQFTLGFMYLEGQGVPQDYKEAAKWFSRAAEQGDATAQYTLGMMYSKGEGVPQDEKAAVKWYSKAAEQGHASAQYNLGVMYSKGEGVPQDEKAAVKWYSKAAEQGHASAQYNLGVMYAQGKGVPQDYVLGYKWCSLAAAQGNKYGIEARDILRKGMSPAQIAEAQRLSREFSGQADKGPGAIQEETLDAIVDVDKDIPKGKAKRPDGIAVIIGNDHYSRYGHGIPDVVYAARDAAYMKRYVVETLGFDEKNVIYEQDVTQGSLATIFGTGNNYRGKLYNYVKAGKSDVFVYYTGHGAPDPAGKGAFLVPVDANVDYISSNGYPLETFYKNLGKVREKIGSGRMTVILDACFSGDSEGGVLFKNISPAMIKTASPVGNLEEAVIFTSAGESEVSQWYPDKRHSLFTYFFMKGLQGGADKNKNRTITVGEMRDYLKEQVPYLARRLGGREQNPVIVGDESLELVSFR